MEERSKLLQKRIGGSLIQAVAKRATATQKEEDVSRRKYQYRLVSISNAGITPLLLHSAGS